MLAVGALLAARSQRKHSSYRSGRALDNDFMLYPCCILLCASVESELTYALFERDVNRNVRLGQAIEVRL